MILVQVVTAARPVQTLLTISGISSAARAYVALMVTRCSLKAIVSCLVHGYSNFWKG